MLSGVGLTDVATVYEALFPYLTPRQADELYIWEIAILLGVHHDDDDDTDADTDAGPDPRSDKSRLIRQRIAHARGEGPAPEPMPVDVGLLPVPLSEIT